MNKKLINLIKIIIGILLIFYLINKVGLINIINIIKSINIIYLPLILLLWLVNLLIGATNIKIMLLALGEKLSFTKTLKYYLKSWAYGLFLPGKLGELSIIYFLKKENIGLSKGTIIAIIDKMITFFVLFLIALFGLINILNLKEIILVLFLISFVFVLSSLFLITSYGRRIIRTYILRHHSKEFKNFFKNLSYLFRSRKIFLLLNIFLTFLKWSLIFMIVYLLFSSVNYQINFIILMSAVSIGIIISLIPISISGLGVRENSSLAVFMYYNVPSTTAGGILLVHTLIRYIIGIIIFLVT